MNCLSIIQRYICAFLSIIQEFIGTLIKFFELFVLVFFKLL